MKDLKTAFAALAEEITKFEQRYKDSSDVIDPVTRNRLHKNGDPEIYWLTEQLKSLQSAVKNMLTVG